MLVAKGEVLVHVIWLASLLNTSRHADLLTKLVGGLGGSNSNLNLNLDSPPSLFLPPFGATTRVSFTANP